MNVKDLITKKLNFTVEQNSRLIVLRTGGWLEDRINPTEWPGGLNAPKFEQFDPEFSLKPSKLYVEYCFSDNKERQRLDLDVSEIA